MTQHVTTCEIDVAAYESNLAAIDAHVGSASVVPVLKADAYGHGLEHLVPVVSRLGVERVAVAQLGEARRVRELGFVGRILVLSAVVPALVAEWNDPLVEHTVPDLAALSSLEAVRSERRHRVHLKIDTGMGRLGVAVPDASALVEAAVASNTVDVVGVYSHFANADAADLSDAQGQLDRFLEAITAFDRLGEPMPLRHMANSGAIEQLPAAHLDMVRAGIVSYGVHPSPETVRAFDVRPVMTWRSTVTFAKRVPAGTPVSYGSTWTTPTATNLATVPVGYGDGYRRGLGNVAEVLIDGARYPIVGRVCMDQFVVDAGDADLLGRPVVLIGESGGDEITADELAGHVDTISYEIVTAVTGRVPRVTVGARESDR